MMSLIRRLRIWWGDQPYYTETQPFIDDFVGVYTASGGPRPMGKRRDDETMREYRARFVEWLTDPSAHANAASEFLRPSAGL